MGHGSRGIVFTVTSTTVVNTACRYDIHPSGFAEEEAYQGRECHLRNSYRTQELASENCPQLLSHTRLTISSWNEPARIFSTMCQDFICAICAICATYRILVQIINAVSLLERMGILHGGLRPPISSLIGMDTSSSVILGSLYKLETLFITSNSK